jgi:cardiolipin synthase A/B
LSAPVKIITEGDIFYAEAIRTINRARSSVAFMVYIWQDDEIGHQFEAALIKAAVRGVSVRLVIDAVGSFDLPVAALTRLRQAGVHVYMHHRIRVLRWGWLRYLIRRNHRKIVVVDDRIAFTGGFNIMRECSQKYYGQRRWLDMMIETKVPALVMHLKQQYKDACRRARHEKWSSRLLTRSGNRVIVSGGGRVVTYSMSRWLKRRLRHARTHITIAVPYFIPYGFFRRILAKKLKEGVRVEIILSEVSDLPWIDAVSFALAKRLSKKGAEVYLYRGDGVEPRFSHTKLFRIDEWAGTGSANYDYRSMVLNLDTLLFFRHPPGEWNSAYAAMRSQSRIATDADLKTGFRAWLIWPFRWLL